MISDDAASSLGDGSGVRRQDVLSLDGDYTRGDVLHIYDREGKELARGLTEYTSEEARTLINNLDVGAEQLLGYKTHAELVRPENLVLLEEKHLTWQAPEGFMKNEGGLP